MNATTASSGHRPPPPIEFEVPPGFQPPDHGGDEFDVVCTFRAKPGRLCLIKLGDYEMPGYEDKDDNGQASTPNKPSYGNVATGLMAGMGDGGGQ